ncbi:uncharacterized protein PV09_05792 [Verruconis gallopava]|uniref:Transmembrane protein UsgS n=1 Tax=Verruconis gallopava TaxID=253628 RepID=A0A0D2AVI3_9PEZI|nr:uncharacterized protein PV09_05792 [Verruconis gallopava]KIW03149.1 hypothetical protein PV09_05792 [Verruconis gallopava]
MASSKLDELKARAEAAMPKNVDEWRAKVANFDPNAILRGFQLTLVGAHRALQNPKMFTSDHYRQAALAVAAGIAIRMLIEIPIFGVRALLWIIGLFVNLDHSSWDNDVVRGLQFVEHSVLQIPFFLMSLMRYITPTLDNMFMESLDWVDRTYLAKHKSDDPKTLRAMYYPNLAQYPKRGPAATVGEQTQKKNAFHGITEFLLRFGRRALISLAVYLLSFVPYVGRLVLPAASFYTFKNAVGTQPAIVIFAIGIVMPKKYLVVFLQTYFSSRSLMRELLEPYFSRIQYTKEQKRKWFKEREGVLFGFGVGFFVLLKIPLVGVLIYGIAEASTAYLITKITDPPPPPSQSTGFAETQVRWKNKHEFMSLPLTLLDAVNTNEGGTRRNSRQQTTGNTTALPEKQYS